jgi:hypothetical protein
VQGSGESRQHPCRSDLGRAVDSKGLSLAGRGLAGGHWAMRPRHRNWPPGTGRYAGRSGDFVGLQGPGVELVTARAQAVQAGGPRPPSRWYLSIATRARKWWALRISLGQRNGTRLTSSHCRAPAVAREGLPGSWDTGSSGAWRRQVKSAGWPLPSGTRCGRDGWPSTFTIRAGCSGSHWCGQGTHWRWSTLTHPKTGPRTRYGMGFGSPCSAQCCWGPARPIS